MRLALVLEYFVEWVDADPNFRSFEYGGKPLGHRAVICIHDMHGPGHRREIDPQQVLSYNHLHMAVARLADMRQRYEAEEATKAGELKTDETDANPHPYRRPERPHKQR